MIGIFFSTLLLSSFNYHNVSATSVQLVPDDGDNTRTTDDYIVADIRQLDHIFFCDNFLNGKRDFVSHFSDVHVFPNFEYDPETIASQTFDSKKALIVGGSGNTFENEIIKKPNSKSNSFPGGGIDYTLFFDHCQDGEFTSQDRDEIKPSVFKLDSNSFIDLRSPEKSVIKSQAKDKLSQAITDRMITIGVVLGYQGIVAAAATISAKLLCASQPFICEQLVDKYLGVMAVAAFDYLIRQPVFDATANEVEKYRKLAKDPPNLNYKNISSIKLDSTLLNLNKIEEEPQSIFLKNITELTNKINSETALVEAFTNSIEKFEGAKISNDPFWTLIHAMAIKKYSELLINHLLDINKDLSNSKEFLVFDPLILNDTSKDNVESILENFNGFDKNERMEFKKIGFTDDIINNIESFFKSDRLLTFSQKNITNDIDSSIQLNNNFIESLRIFLQDYSDVVNKILVDHNGTSINSKFIPEVSSGGPYLGYLKIPFKLDANVTNTDQRIKIVKYEWDLDGDGNFDDANDANPSITYNNFFEGYIGLKATNNIGISNISYSPIKILPNNHSPKIVSFTPLDLNPEMLINSSKLFTISHSDPDNDPISVKWLIDNIDTHVDNDEFTFFPNHTGFHKISAQIRDNSQNSHISQQTWSVLVLDIDADQDSWHKNVDCNDNNPNINQGVTEIRYNGIDDDCNPQTLDINTPPVAKNQTIGLFQNNIRTISFSGDTAATDVDKNLLTFEIVKGPENGTLGPIKVNPFNNLIITADYTPNPNFHGKDSFTFIAKDKFAQSNVAKVNLNVGILQIPTAVDRTITVNEDTPTQIELRGISPDGHPLTFILEGTRSEGTKGQPAMGTIKNITQTGPTTANVTYIPPTDFNNDISTRTDSIAFAVKDGEPVPGFQGREIDRGGITIKFTGVNDAPQPYNNIISTQMNASVGIELRALDADNDFFIKNPVLNNGITFRIDNQPSHGTLSSINSQLVSIGQQPLPLNQTIDTVTYTPDPGFIGKDSFSFIATDGILDSTKGIITINVKDPNEAVSKEFEDGDVILGLTGCTFNCIDWHKNDGTFVKNIHNFSIVFGSHTGGDFDPEGNLYITTFGRISGPFNVDGIQIFNSNGAYIGGLKDKDDFGCLDFTDPTIPHFGFPCMAPESIVFDKNGDMYVGGIATSEGDPRFPNDLRDAIRQFDPNHNLISVYDVDIEDRGSDWIDLAPDQCTMYYTSEDIHVKRYNICTNQQLEDFSNVYGPGRSFDKLSGTNVLPNFALRLLPSGDMLVASHTEIWRLDGEGNLIQKYDARGQDAWFALNIDPDGKSFWSATLGGREIYRFDIETGKILQYFKTNNPNIGVSGIIIKGEPKISSIEVPPIAVSQNVTVNKDTQILINMTGSDIANDPLNFSIINPPSFGVLNSITKINNNTSQITYIPNTGFDGTDSFTFKANDGKLDSNNTGIINIHINKQPIALPDIANTIEGKNVNIPIFANDADPDLNDNLSISAINSTFILGDVIHNQNNSTLTFVPFEGFAGTEEFTYTIMDSHGLTDHAKVTVNVQSLNTLPIANPQNISIVENTPINITLTAFDLNLNDNLTFLRESNPSNGFLNNFNSTEGQIQYTPLHNFDGIDTFSFKVFDGKEVSESANVTIFITEDGINDPPVVQSERVSSNVSQQIAVDVLQNDIDPNGDLLTLTNFTGPFNGTAFLNSDQTITYQSDRDFNGSDVLYYRVADQFGDFDIGQLIIDVKGDALKQIIQVSLDRFVTTTRNQPIDIELVATATIDRPVAFFIVDAPDNGTLGDITTLSNLSSSVKYTPNNGFLGKDSFTYIAIDDKGVVSNIGTIRVSIDDIVENAPVASDSLVTLDEDTSIPIQLDASDSDVNDNLIYSIESQPISGIIVSFDSSTGSLIYEPNTNFNGNDGFLFKAVDQDGLESNIATVLITVNHVNDPPVANNQQVEADQNTPLQITLSGADPIDNGTLSQFRIVNSPTNGQLSTFNQITGELTYTPNNNFFGSDSFTFKVIDSQGLESTESAVISINVKEVTPPPVNNPPVAVDKTVETNSNTPVSITLEGTDIDQGDTINTFTIVLSPTNGQISNFNSNTGTLTYTPNNNFVGQDSFTFKVTDTHGLESTNTGLVTINVKSTQEPPPDNEQPPLPLPPSVCTDSNNNSVKPKGTQGNDDLVGTSQRDTITGLGGNDRFNGCSGDDTLNGNSGNDGIAGGPGDDNLHGNEGNDYLQGDSGSDSLYGNEGNDILVGNEGRDRFFCGTGNDIILDFDYPLDVKSNDCEEF